MGLYPIYNWGEATLCAWTIIHFNEMYWLVIFYPNQNIWRNMETMEGLIPDFGWKMVKITDRNRRPDMSLSRTSEVILALGLCGNSLKLQAFVVLWDISIPQTKFSDSNLAKPGSWSIPKLAPLLLADLIKLQPLVLLEPQSCLGKVSGSPDQRWSNSKTALKVFQNCTVVHLQKLELSGNAGTHSNHKRIEQVNNIQYPKLFLDWIYLLSFGGCYPNFAQGAGRQRRGWWHHHRPATPMTTGDDHRWCPQLIAFSWCLHNSNNSSFTKLFISNFGVILSNIWYIRAIFNIFFIPIISNISMGFSYMIPIIQ